MCQVNSFNLDHERCIQGCNCCKSKDSAAAVSATLAERERIIKLLEENLEGVLRFSNANVKTPTSPEIVMSSFTGDIIALIKGETNE